MKLTEEQKRQIIDKVREFSEIHSKMEEFEEKLKEVQKEHNNIMKRLEEIRDEEKGMVESFCLDEEGKKDYEAFVTSLIASSVELRENEK